MNTHFKEPLLFRILENLARQIVLEYLSVIHLFLNSPGRYKPINRNMLPLPNSPRSLTGLHVSGRVLLLRISVLPRYSLCALPSLDRIVLHDRRLRG